VLKKVRIGRVPSSSGSLAQHLSGLCTGISAPHIEGGEARDEARADARAVAVTELAAGSESALLTVAQHGVWLAAVRGRRDRHASGF
jgi:hypothetical protein